MLVFHFKQLQKLAIFDLTQAKIVRYIDLPGDDVCFAAGADSLLVVFSGQKLLHRWSLKTLERERTVPLPCDGDVKIARMGCNSQGPLMLVPAQSPCVMVDVQTLQSFVTGDRMSAGGDRHGTDLRVSADGQTFVWWTRGYSPMRFTTIRYSGQTSTSSLGCLKLTALIDAPGSSRRPTAACF